MSTNRARGFSLVEILVSVALLSLVTGLFVAFLFPTMKHSAQGTARADLQQMAVMALDRIQRDLLESGTRGISTIPRAEAEPRNDPVVVAAIPIQDVGADAQPLWAQRVVVYWWDEEARRLSRREWPPEPPTELSVTLDPSRPRTLPYADLRALALQRNGKEASVANDVVDFDVTDADPGPGVASPVVVRMTVERGVNQQEEPESVTMERSVTLRNTY